MVHMNIASVLSTGLCGHARASGRAVVAISGFSHPLIEGFHPLPADEPPSLQQHVELRSMP
jgi:hypothetical protein